MWKDKTLLLKTQLHPSLIQAMVTDDMIDPKKARDLYSIVGIKGPTNDTDWMDSLKAHAGLLNTFYTMQGYAMYGGKKAKPLQQKKRSPRRR